MMCKGEHRNDPPQSQTVPNAWSEPFLALLFPIISRKGQKAEVTDHDRSCIICFQYTLYVLIA